ncbi:hypothetical protein C8Q79DRAFT_1008270 [Trametes meyenii]|nr:hypothetical protein C8Q79DRAFT_1008270 [Trametes meyenii]
MSDPPPKKVSSLRDRIAAFENKGAAPAPGPPPVPRPKPGHITWQPKAASPPTSPKHPGTTSTSAADEVAEARKAAGMSAADAKESIGKLSLKERMAALQGSGAFGAPAGAVSPPPRPAGEKPRWKPPPVVQKVEPIGGDDDDKPTEKAKESASEGEVSKSPQEEKEEGEHEGEPKEEGEPDPEEEERQRRAALAARMARLGGARIGMAPPIFGKKPDIPPKKIHKEEEPAKIEETPKDNKPTSMSPTAETSEVPVVAEPIDESGSAPTEGVTPGSSDYFGPVKQESTPSATLSPESASTTPPVRSPAMPVPQAPKRAAPPRKRPAKSPSPAQQLVIDQEIHDAPKAVSPTNEPPASAPAENEEPHVATGAAEPGTPGDREPEVLVEQKEDSPGIIKAEPSQEEEAHEKVTVVGPLALDDTQEVRASESTIAAFKPEDVAEERHEEQPPVTMTADEEPKALVAEEASEAPIGDEPTHEEPEPVVAAEPVEASVEEPEEEDEVARRKRIAERIAKSGGFNPFGGGLPPPPIRRESSDSARSPIASPPPLPIRRDSHQDEPIRKDSVGSVRAETGIRKDSLDGTEDLCGAAPVESSGDVDDEAGESQVMLSEHAGTLEEDQGAESRGEHEASHTHAPANEEPERESEEAYDGTNDYMDVHERQAEPEDLEDKPVPAVAHHPPPHVLRPLPTAPVAQEEEGEEQTPEFAPSPAIIPPPPKRQPIPPPPKRQSIPPPPRVVPAPPTPPVDESTTEEHALPEIEQETEHARLAREVESEHEVEEQEYSPHEENAHTLRHESERGPHEGRPVEAALAPPPPPPRHAPVPPVFTQDDEDEVDEDDFDAPPPPPPPHRTSVNVPVPSTHVQSHDDDKEECEEEAEESSPEEVGEAEEAAPPPPPPRSVHPASPIPTGVPRRPIPPPLRAPSPTREDEGELLNESDVDPIDPEFYSPQKSPGPDGKAFSPSPLQSFSVPVVSPPPPPPARLVSPPPVDIPLPPPQHIASSPPPQLQVISPPPPPPRVASPPAERATSPIAAHDQEEPQDQDNEEDAEQARRRTIAERMAKLGGIRFGAPPPMPTARRPPPPPETEHKEDEDGSELEKSTEAEDIAPEEEEDEFARKQRIAARIAGMGGMRFGMLPGAAPPVPRLPVRRESQDNGNEVKSPPPKRSAPVPPPAPPPSGYEEEEHGEESDFQHVSDSERVAQEESELEEVTHSDAEEEAPPPPVPDRGARRVSTGPPPVPQARPLSPPSLASPPPVPRTRPPPPPSFTYPPPPPLAPTTHDSQGDFVIVEQGESVDEPPPPPPPPRAARPPPRGHGAPLPPPPPPAVPPPPEASDAQWEQSSIPSVDFGGEADLSLSGQWSEDSTNYPPPPPPGRSSASVAASDPSQQVHNVSTVAPVIEQHLTPDELMAHWGRVGVQAHEVAAALFERSKKGVVGDGSYLGFVNTVLGQVPTAAQPASPYESFGYLVYSQAAAAVQRRVSDIMPGDVFVAHEAKFKGHKGLQSYHQHVGVGQPLLAVIGDFEAKKSKVKVYQANQHVGQQSVELASYRLEDLKSGSVKVFRVLEA